jgi:hypothetical protein
MSAVIKKKFIVFNMNRAIMIVGSQARAIRYITEIQRSSNQPDGWTWVPCDYMEDEKYRVVAGRIDNYRISEAVNPNVSH